MQQLVADHRNFATFVEILENQADRLESGERCDLEIVEAILGYFQRYGDQCHHPREDLLYVTLRAKDPVAAARSSTIESDHARLQHATRSLLAEVRAACDGGSLDAYGLARHVLGYAAGYRAHFEAENEHLFPLAVQVLTPADWRLVERSAAIMTGAERALHVQDRFLALRDYIHRIDRLNP